VTGNGEREKTMDVVGFGTVAMDVLMQTAKLPAEDGFAVIEKSEYLA